MTDQLNPCPFCGGKAKRMTLQDENNFGGDVIACAKCGARSRVVFGEKEGLVDAWNRRASTVVAERTDAVMLAAALKPFADAFAASAIQSYAGVDERLAEFLDGNRITPAHGITVRQFRHAWEVLNGESALMANEGRVEHC